MLRDAALYKSTYFLLLFYNWTISAVACHSLVVDVSVTWHPDEDDDDNDDEDVCILIPQFFKNYYAPAPVGEAGALGGHRRLSSIRLSVRPSV